jgi:hypothetical protein
MRELTGRELIVATRCAAVPIAGLVSLAACAAFVLAWSPGVPLFASLDVYAQTRAVHWIVLAVVLPYAVVRSSPADRLDSIRLMAALARTRPGAAVAAKILGACVVAMVVILTGLPAMVLAQQAAAVPIYFVAADLLPLAGLALFVAASATGAVMIARDRLRAWLWTSGIVIAVMIATVWRVAEIASLGLLCGVTGAAAAVALSTLAGDTPMSSGEAHGG